MKIKMKILSLTLLSAIAICQTEGADRYKKMTEATEQAPKAEAKIKKAKDTAAAIAPKLDVPADPKGRQIDDAITDVHTKLGHDVGGAAGDHANKRVNDAIARLHAGQPDVHTAITNVDAVLGAGHAANPPHAPGTNIHEKATNLLDRLRAIPAGHVIVAAPHGAPPPASIEEWLAVQGK